MGRARCGPYRVWVGLAVTVTHDKRRNGWSSEFPQASRESLPLVVHGERAIEGNADLDPCMRIAAVAWAGEDMEEALAELDSVIVGHGAQVFEAADALQGLPGGRRPLGRGEIRGAASEAGIVAGRKRVSTR